MSLPCSNSRTSAFAHPWPGASTACASQAPGLSSGFDRENAANVVASAVTATLVIATTAALDDDPLVGFIRHLPFRYRFGSCLLYTSDAADERSSVDLGGRR